MQSTLYIGLDDSNHAGKVRGEIVTAVFSVYYRDSLEYLYGRRGDICDVNKAMLRRGRHSNFTILTSPEYHKTRSNLPVAAPLLILNFLEGFRRTEELTRLEIGLDGKATEEDKEIILRDLPDRFEANIKGYPKGGRKKHNCPRTVYYADAIANSLFRRPLEETLADKRFVHFP